MTECTAEVARSSYIGYYFMKTSNDESSFQ